MNSDPKEAFSPPKPPITRIWSAYRRHVFLVSLAVALVVFLVWLPATPRAAVWAALQTHQPLVGMLFVFALIALSLLWSAGQRLDAWVFLFFNLRGYHPQWLDRAMWLATQLGNVWTALISATLFFGFNDHGMAVEIILGTLTLWLLVETLKLLTDRTRPFRALGGARVIGWRARGRSFPSGHTAQIFFLTTVLSHRFQLGIEGTIALYAVAMSVGFTRIYVGAHYPRDVIGGAVLGSVWGILATLVDPYWLGLGF
jgi:membrane-associated phospholipid phosphatase